MCTATKPSEPKAAIFSAVSVPHNKAALVGIIDSVRELASDGAEGGHQNKTSQRTNGPSPLERDRFLGWAADVEKLLYEFEPTENHAYDPLLQILELLQFLQDGHVCLAEVAMDARALLERWDRSGLFDSESSSEDEDEENVGKGDNILDNHRGLLPPDPVKEHMRHLEQSYAYQSVRQRAAASIIKRNVLTWVRSKASFCERVAEIEIFGRTTEALLKELSLTSSALAGASTNASTDIFALATGRCDPKSRYSGSIAFKDLLQFSKHLAIFPVDQALRTVEDITRRRYLFDSRCAMKIQFVWRRVRDTVRARRLHRAMEELRLQREQEAYAKREAVKEAKKRKTSEAGKRKGTKALKRSSTVRSPIISAVVTKPTTAIESPKETPREPSAEIRETSEDVSEKRKLLSSPLASPVDISTHRASTHDSTTSVPNDRFKALVSTPRNRPVQSRDAGINSTDSDDDTTDVEAAWKSFMDTVATNAIAQEEVLREEEVPQSPEEELTSLSMPPVTLPPMEDNWESWSDDEIEVGKSDDLEIEDTNNRLLSSGKPSKSVVSATPTPRIKIVVSVNKTAPSDTAPSRLPRRETAAWRRNHSQAPLNRSISVMRPPASLPYDATFHNHTGPYTGAGQLSLMAPFIDADRLKRSQPSVVPERKHLYDLDFNGAVRSDASFAHIAHAFVSSREHEVQQVPTAPPRPETPEKVGTATPETARAGSRRTTIARLRSITGGHEQNARARDVLNPENQDSKDQQAGDEGPNRTIPGESSSPSYFIYGAKGVNIQRVVVLRKGTMVYSPLSGPPEEERTSTAEPGENEVKEWHRTTTTAIPQDFATPHRPIKRVQQPQRKRLRKLRRQNVKSEPADPLQTIEKPLGTSPRRLTDKPHELPLLLRRTRAAARRRAPIEIDQLADNTGEELPDVPEPDTNKQMWKRGGELPELALAQIRDRVGYKPKPSTPKRMSIIAGRAPPPGELRRSDGSASGLEERPDTVPTVQETDDEGDDAASQHSSQSGADSQDERPETSSSEPSDAEDQPQLDPQSQELHDEFRRLHLASRERELTRRRSLLAQLQLEQDAAADSERPRQAASDELEQRRARRRKSLVGHRVEGVSAADAAPVEVTAVHYSDEKAASRRRLRVKTRDARVDPFAELSDGDGEQLLDAAESAGERRAADMTPQERDAAFARLLAQYLGLLQCAPAEFLPQRTTSRHSSGNVEMDAAAAAHDDAMLELTLGDVEDAERRAPPKARGFDGFAHEAEGAEQPGEPLAMPLTLPTSPTLLPLAASPAASRQPPLSVQQYFQSEGAAAGTDFSAEMQKSNDEYRRLTDAITGTCPLNSGRGAASSQVDSASTSTPKPGKKRKAGTNVSIDLQTKIRIIEVAEQYQYDPKSTCRSKPEGGGAAPGKQAVNGIRLAEQFGLNKSTVSRILKRKEEFKKAYYKDNISGCSKHINKKSKFDKLNRLVENWFDMNREKNGAITDTLIRDVGKRYAEELGIEGFRGSNGWVRSLRNRKEHSARTSVTIEDQEAEKRKKDNEAVERMRLVFPNGVKDMARFFKDLSTYLEKDGGGVGNFGDMNANPSSNGSARDAAVVLAGASYSDMDDEISRDTENAVAEEFLKKKMIESMRAWSQELMASELAKLKKRMKPRQAAVLKEPALDRATNLGITLPRFNFVEARPPRRRRDSPRAVTAVPTLNGFEQNNPVQQPASADLDEVLYSTVSRRAKQFEDPSLTLETTISRIWQALLRHSERGRFGNPEAGNVNPICTALCLEATDQIFAACGASALLRSVLVGGLANSVYTKYDPDQEFENQLQYADVVGRQSKQISTQEEEIVKLVKLRELAEQHVFDQLSAAGVGQLLQQMDLSRRVSAVTEILAPVLDDELLLVLWNATATTQASANQHLQTSENSAADTAPDSMSWNETRKRGAALASLVLQERVRLVILVWQRLSTEEKRLAYKALDPSISTTQAATTLKSVLHALEETYVSELIHHQRQLSRRNLNLASQLGIINESGPSKTSASGKKLTLPPTTPRALGKLRGGRSRARTIMISGDSADPSYAGVDSKASIPQVLLGALVSSSPGYGRLNQIHLSPNQGRSRPVSSGILPEQLLASHSDVLRTCEDVFDLLCEIEQQQVEAIEKHNCEPGSHAEEVGERIVIEARLKLRDLLCTYVEPSEPIQERFHRCEDAREKRLELESSRSDDERKLTELMNAFISGQRRNPELLVNVVNRSPETLLRAITLNPGMLLFSITKFPDQVKRFLSLDPKACDFLDGLVQKHKGVQLLWKSPGVGGGHDGFQPINRPRTLSIGAEELAMALPRGDSLEHGALLLLEWFTSHLNDLTDLLLEHPKPLQLLFIKMHQRGDVSAFFQLMLLLQQTTGVQNFISRASVATLERLALEDQSAVLAVLREIFQCRENRGDSSDDSSQPVRPNRDLLHELQASPHLVACLSAMDPSVLQEVFLGNIDVWAPFFVDMVASNDTLLRQSTIHVEGGDTLLRLLTAVMDGTTAILDLATLDRALSVSDVEKTKQHEASARRKEHQCIYLRGRSTVFGAMIIPQIAVVGYNPRRFLLYQSASATTSTAGSAVGAPSSQDRGNKDSKGGRVLLRPTRVKKNAPPIPTTGKKRHLRNGEATELHTTSASNGDNSTSERILIARGGEVPSMWQLYLRLHTTLLSREDAGERSELLPPLSKARVKALVLDIWLEFLKTDHLQLDNTSLWCVAPFVCDYFIARYDSPAAVGARLENLLNGLVAFQDDPRVAFFAASCGLGDVKTSDAYEAGPPSYDVFLYYLHALAHLFYGQMKIFQPGKRLDETPSGICPIAIHHAVVVTNALFTFSLTETALRALRAEIETLPRIKMAAIVGMIDLQPAEVSSEVGNENSSDFMSDLDSSTRFVELDDVMNIFLKQWTTKTHQTEEAFAANDLGGDRIGMDEFVKIVTGVSAGRISARECRLVFGDVGQEFMNLEMFMRVTRAYQLRAFDTHLPEVNLDERDLQDLRLSVGRANVVSTQREVEDLARYWRSVRSDVIYQLEATHQKKTTKLILKKQSALIEKLVTSTPALLQQLQVQQLYAKRQATSPAHTAALQKKLDRVWHEVRTCVKMLHRAKLTQHYLSGLFIRSNMLRWIGQARRRAHEEEERQQSRFPTPLLPSSSGISRASSVQSISDRNM
ncbi:unnamed protein product [Phytophthora fragariaefolia]|uniref:Unnamed protein product n=1 Tax=Phytophthora fragariaefolia TaxID=1490495 RepID=A0A9W6YDC5_9STRA|nr:unnamed protein product [Phytophthora fragariaefolia]